MAVQVRSTNAKRPANILSARHAMATGGETRLIRLGKPANDNHNFRQRRIGWLSLAALTLAMALLWLA